MIVDAYAITQPSSHMHSLRSHVLRFARFGIVGGAGTVVNTVVLYLLVHFGAWNHLVAAAVATEAAILSNFVMNDRWTFRDAGVTHTLANRALRYHAIALAGAVISLGVLAALMFGMNMHYLVANLLGIAAGTVWNYTLNARLTWATSHIGASSKLMPPATYGVDQP